MPSFSCYINHKLNPSSIIMENPFLNQGKSCTLGKKALKETLGFVDALERFGEQLGRISRAIRKDLDLQWIEIVRETRAIVEPKE